METLKNIVFSSGPTGGPGRLGVYDLFLLLGALVALTLLLLVWAKYIRREKKPRRRSHSSKEYELVPVATASRSGEDDDEDDEPAEKQRRKFRKRRRDHRGRNPTLAETGGLPPLRGENSNTVTPPQ